MCRIQHRPIATSIVRSRQRVWLLAIPLLVLPGCATAVMTGAVVGTTAKVGVLAVKGTAKATVGTGKLIYRGGKAVGGIATSDEPTRTVTCAEIPEPKPQTCLVY